MLWNQPKNKKYTKAGSSKLGGHWLMKSSHRLSCKIISNHFGCRHFYKICIHMILKIFNTCIGLKKASVLVLSFKSFVLWSWIWKVYAMYWTRIWKFSCLHWILQISYPVLRCGSSLLCIGIWKFSAVLDSGRILTCIRIWKFSTFCWILVGFSPA